MKRITTLLLALVLIAGLWGCSSGSGVTADKFATVYNNTYSANVDAFNISETSEGLSFNYDNISGTTDQKQNINYITIVNRYVKPSNFSSESSISSFVNYFGTADPGKFNSYDFNTFRCISDCTMLYEVCLGKSISFEGVSYILSSKTPVEVDNWTFAVSFDEDDSVFTIEATYNK